MINTKTRTLMPLERRGMRLRSDRSFKHVNASATFPFVKNELAQIEQNVKM